MAASDFFHEGGSLLLPRWCVLRSRPSESVAGCVFRRPLPVR
ncbi:hypothetical protein [Kingella potus]|nr:hypothetical protein [Kingella potus]